MFERVAHQEITAAFKEEGVDFSKVAGEEAFMYITAASELMKYDDKALSDLKTGGKTAAVQKYVREAKQFLDKFYVARATRERARAGTAGPGRGQPLQGNNEGKPPTLDEMIDNPELIHPGKYRPGT
jgi:hypothetical protein